MREVRAARDIVTVAWRGNTGGAEAQDCRSLEMGKLGLRPTRCLFCLLGLQTSLIYNLVVIIMLARQTYHRFTKSTTTYMT